jgi:hypothetical protein
MNFISSRISLAFGVAILPLISIVHAASAPNTAPASTGAVKASADKPAKLPEGASTLDRSTVEPTGAELRKTMADAKSQAKKLDVNSAEQTLTKNNVFKANTPEWHQETTRKLLHLAHDLAREGNSTAAVTTLANQSLQHLSQMEALAKDNPTKARAKAASAYIYERFSGDPTSAIAAYKAALLLAPDDAATKEALDRLEKADANLRAKIHAPKK